MRRNWRIVSCFVLLAVIINYSYAEELKQITCTGKVVDDQDRPLAGAKVALHVIVYGHTVNPFDTKLLKEVITKADGAFSFTTNAKSDVYRYGSIVAEKEGLAYAQL